MSTASTSPKLNAPSATPLRSNDSGMSAILGGTITVWFLTVAVAAQRGWIAQLYMPWIAAIVAATIAIPTLAYFASPRLQRYVESIGHRRIALFHAWRVPAALLFFWYGVQGQLPPAFWSIAGLGDLIAGVYGLYASLQPETRKTYLTFHLFGFADFVSAVGIGLTYTLLSDPRMQPVAQLPLAWIPLFGVGLSGASHLMAFDMLRRNVGFSSK
ncbi:MAG: hypothetical protein ACK5OB_14205 [Pirellula sp.]